MITIDLIDKPKKANKINALKSTLKAIFFEISKIDNNKVLADIDVKIRNTDNDHKRIKLLIARQQNYSELLQFQLENAILLIDNLK